MIRLPIRSRLTLISTGTMALVLAATGVLLYLRLGSSLTTSIDMGLRSRAQTIAAGLGSKRDGVADGPDAVTSDQSFAQVVTRNGSVITSSPPLGNGSLLGLATLGSISQPRYMDRRLTANGEATDVRILALPDGGRVVVVGANLEGRGQALDQLRGLLLFGGPAVLALVAFVAWLLAGAALTPVERMRVEASVISASEPGRRLSVPTSGDEIESLGRTLNEMLARLEEAMKRERRFVDDASHELRTPIGIMRAELELALSRPRSTEELRTAIASTLEETEQLGLLAEDLLLLAKSDAGAFTIRREPVDVGAVIEAVLSEAEARAHAQAILIERDLVPKGLTADLDPLRVRQVIRNLVDNALAHTPAGGSVRVGATESQGRIEITVTDTGPGFADDLLPHALEPFSRSDAARQRSEEGGAGLGLAIVNAISRAHGGRTKIGNDPRGGAVVVTIFPAQA